jgi:exodeoxyribonuclease V alpha subunit
MIYPLLYQMSLQGKFAAVDYYFAEAMLRKCPEATQEGAALLFLAMYASRNGHLCLSLKRDDLQTLVEESGLTNELSRELLSLLTSARLPDNLAGLHRFEDRLYFEKNWFYETEILKSLKRLNLPSVVLSYDNSLLTEEQKRAVSNALSHPLSIITGGPGTGKTFTAALIAKAFEGKKIILCAPTGKAVMQLATKVGDQVKGCTSGTIHSLYKNEARAPLSADLIIVDECSMIDAPLFASLLSRLNSQTTIVLMGDCNQLSSVEQGSIFADIIGAKMAIPTVHLTQCMRSERVEILEIAEAIKAGEDQKLLESAAPLSLSSLLLLAEQNYPRPSATAPDPYELLASIDHFRILSCLRKGPFGVDALNAAIAEHFMSKMKSGFLALPILITKSDYRIGLLNGETGLIIREKRDGKFHDFQTFFSGKEVPPSLLPSYSYGYCLSVHKSQGSEYDHVVVLIPPGSEVFGREVLYTAVTRARSSLQIFGDKEKIKEAVAKKSHRLSGLVIRNI